MSGWIADHRKELDSNIWLMPPMYHRTWQWIKYSVNNSEGRIPNRDGTIRIIKPGQRATSYRTICKGVGYYEGLKWKEPNPKTIKSILDWLVVQGMIILEGNSEGTVITVVNWEFYQEKKPKGNTKETPKKQSLDTNNKDKTIINNNEQQKNDSFDLQINRIRSTFPKEMTKTKKVADDKLPKLINEHGEDKLIRAIKCYILDVKKKRKDFPKLNYMNEGTFWNGRYMDFLQDDVVKVETEVIWERIEVDE